MSRRRMPIRWPFMAALTVVAAIGIASHGLSGSASSQEREIPPAALSILTPPPSATHQQAANLLDNEKTAQDASSDAQEADGGDSEVQTVRETVTIRSGDTLMALLVKTGVARPDAHEAIEALRDVFDPRRIRPGQDVVVEFQENGGEPVFQAVALAPQQGIQYKAERNGDGSFEAVEVEAELRRELSFYSGTINSSLYVAATGAGLPPTLLVEMIRPLSYSVDFQRQIQPGDTFEVLTSRYVDEEGTLVRHGNVKFARMTLSGREHVVYRFQDSDGYADFFDAEGHSVRRALMRTPIDGARLSSGFGQRRHPILGYTTMHRGVDFAAPTGTPIMAAGDGVVERASRNGGYGNYILIRHNSEFSTAYAHLSRYASGIRPGARVRQGEIIGYVGATGQATGPHLHYEVLRNGDQVNPMSVDLPVGRQLAGAELERFRSFKRDTDRAVARLAPPTRVAQRHAAD